MDFLELKQELSKQRFAALIFYSENNYNSENLSKTMVEFLSPDKHLKIYKFEYKKDKKIADNFPINKFPSLIITKYGKIVYQEENLKHRIDVAQFAEKLPKILKKI